ncbi:MAG: gamma-glutamyl-gamma-aminobutyrate hydrolase family protein [Negativicutes bacterium]|jgi:putative glutamine amidotransferase
MKKPLIGITAGVQLPDNCKIKSKWYYVSSAYVSSVEQAGGVPAMLSITDLADVIKAHAGMIDGLLLSGGVDVNPLLFDQEPQPKLGEVCVERDWYELALIKEVMLQGKPIFGICRGIQMLNVACGGSLWQDVFAIKPKILKHQQEMSANSGSHTVRMQSGSVAEKCLSGSFVTNSFHHQACKTVASGFVATAWTDDGIIEAIEKPGETLTFGVQWHPEQMAVSHPQMLQLFRELIAAAKNRMERN